MSIQSSQVLFAMKLSGDGRWRVCRCPSSFESTLVRHSYLQVPDVFAVFSVLGMSLPVPLMIEDHHLYCVELRYVVLYGIAWPRSRRSKVHVL